MLPQNGWFPPCGSRCSIGELRLAPVENPPNVSVESNGQLSDWGYWFLMAPLSCGTRVSDPWLAIVVVFFVGSISEKAGL